MRQLTIAALVTAATSGTAAAKELVPTSVDAKLTGDTVTITARYRLRTNESHSFMLPDDAVVVGATVTEAGTQRVLALTPHDKVDAELAGMLTVEENAKQGDVWFARVHGDDDRGAMLEVYGPSKTSVTAEIQIVAPTCFSRDTRYVVIPEEWAERVRRTKVTYRIEACNDGDDEAPLLALPTREAAALPSGDRVAAVATSFAVSSAQQIMRVQLSVASTLAELPKDLSTVILVDESLSLDAAQRTAQRAVVAGYLRAVPESRVQIYGFARRTRPIVDAWGTARALAPRIDKALAALPHSNGSNFDTALAEAARALASATGTRRVLLVTDDAMAKSLAANVARHAKLLPAGVLLNIAVVEPYVENAAYRDDNRTLSPLAAATEGFTVWARSETAKPLDVELLVRPTSFDNLELPTTGVTAFTGIEHQVPLCGESLDAGRSCEWWAVGPAQPLTVAGKLWNRRVVRTLQPTVDVNLARTALGRHLALGTTTHRFDREIQDAARAVSGGYELFARWGGTRPLTHHMGIAVYPPSSRAPHHFGSGVGNRKVTTATYDPTAQIRELVKSCAIAPGSATIAVELTLLEVVAVTVTGSAPQAARTCVEEAVWNHPLSGTGVAASREYTIKL